MLLAIDIEPNNIETRSRDIELMGAGAPLTGPWSPWQSLGGLPPVHSIPDATTVPYVAQVAAAALIDSPGFGPGTVTLGFLATGVEGGEPIRRVETEIRVVSRQLIRVAPSEGEQP